MYFHKGLTNGLFEFNYCGDLDLRVCVCVKQGVCEGGGGNSGDKFIVSCRVGEYGGT